jgi:hypothetical protein
MGIRIIFSFFDGLFSYCNRVFGAIALFCGIAVRWFSLPLMFTMIVAAVTVHLDNGWHAITDPSAPFTNERVIEASNKLGIAKQVLQENTNSDYITSSGSVVMLNKCIEFSVTYFIIYGRWTLCQC